MKQNETVEIFNNLLELNEKNNGLFKFEDRIQMINNINFMTNVLEKHTEIIPDYGLSLKDLYVLNVDHVRPASQWLLQLKLLI